MWLIRRQRQHSMVGDALRYHFKKHIWGSDCQRPFLKLGPWLQHLAGQERGQRRKKAFSCISHALRLVRVCQIALTAAEDSATPQSLPRRSTLLAIQQPLRWLALGFNTVVGPADAEAVDLVNTGSTELAVQTSVLRRAPCLQNPNLPFSQTYTLQLYFAVQTVTEVLTVSFASLHGRTSFG